MRQRCVFYQQHKEDPPQQQVEVTSWSQSFNGVPEPDRRRFETAQGSISSLRVVFDVHQLSHAVLSDLLSSE